MDRLDAMRTFVEAVRRGGFAAAARARDLPRSKVSKQVQALEAALGVQLMMRTTRSIALTEAGQRYYEAALGVLEALELADDAARAGMDGVRGVLRVNAPSTFGMRVLAPLLPMFLARHPDLRMQLALTDEILDAVRGGFDLTLRIADLPDSSLVARTLLPAARWLVASPGFVTAHGVPDSPAGIDPRHWLGYGRHGVPSSITLSHAGEPVRMSGHGIVSSDSGELLREMTEAGLGISLLPEFIVGDAVAAGRLVRILDGWTAPPLAVHVIYPSPRGIPLKTRAFIDFLRETLVPRG
jgi:DNA-binding transcriptional LysR family regulator